MSQAAEHDPPAGDVAGEAAALAELLRARWGEPTGEGAGAAHTDSRYAGPGIWCAEGEECSCLTCRGTRLLQRARQAARVSPQALATAADLAEVVAAELRSWQARAEAERDAEPEGYDGTPEAAGASVGPPGEGAGERGRVEP